MLNKLSLKMKLAVGFGLLLAILVILGHAAYHTIVTLDEAANEVDRKTTEKELAISLENSAMKESSGTRGYLLSGDAKMLERDDQGKREIHQDIEKLAPLVKSEEGKRMYGEIQRAYQSFRVVADSEVQSRREGKSKKAQDAMSAQATAAFQVLDDATIAFSDHLAKGKVRVDQIHDSEVAKGKTRDEEQPAPIDPIDRRHGAPRGQRQRGAVRDQSADFSQF